MLFGFYESQLFVLGAYCICALLLEHQLSSRKRKAAVSNGISQEEGRGTGWKLSSGETNGYTRLARTYLLVYAVVMGADWLQVSRTLVALMPCRIQQP
jgi:MFS transporter, MFS domain-containing protein family, molybdate-anion transporter